MKAVEAYDWFAEEPYWRAAPPVVVLSPLLAPMMLSAAGVASTLYVASSLYYICGALVAASAVVTSSEAIKTDQKPVSTLTLLRSKIEAANNKKQTSSSSLNSPRPERILE